MREQLGQIVVLEFGRTRYLCWLSNDDMSERLGVGHYAHNWIVTKNGTKWSKALTQQYAFKLLELIIKLHFSNAI